MTPTSSVRFFEAQFARQLQAGEAELNPFELAALPFVTGQVLDCGCGMGNLALAAARRGCKVLALDGSAAAVAHLQEVAGAQGLPVTARLSDLRDYAPPKQAFDTVVSIGLLMFFDCAKARRQLERLRSAVRPGGVAAVNVLIEGTTYLDMFDPTQHCLFGRDELRLAFEGWGLLLESEQLFDAPRGLVKRFSTVIARRQAPSVQ